MMLGPVSAAAGGDMVMVPPATVTGTLVTVAAAPGAAAEEAAGIPAPWVTTVPSGSVTVRVPGGSGVESHIRGAGAVNTGSPSVESDQLRLPQLSAARVRPGADSVICSDPRAGLAAAAASLMTRVVVTLPWSSAVTSRSTPGITLG